MKVLSLQCGNGHGFEGWFGTLDDFQSQQTRGLVECPMCADKAIIRLPSAARLNLSGAREPQRREGGVAPPAQADTGAVPALPAPATSATANATLQAQWLKAVQHVMRHTEDVGEQFSDEARRIHYGEVPQRGIRGQATAEQRAELADEGIEVMPLPLPAALKGPVQ